MPAAEAAILLDADQEEPTAEQLANTEAMIARLMEGWQLSNRETRLSIQDGEKLYLIRYDIQRKTKRAA